MLTLWPPLRGMRHAEAAHLALLPAPHPEGDLTGDPPSSSGTAPRAHAAHP
ncbi:hypothetical protein [Nonomuraea salmonea]|uniref:hypothetical protein n=1 Tax=Nonomuraea salmonea TaxID=46181 RepID=UPI0031EB586C